MFCHWSSAVLNSIFYIVDSLPPFRFRSLGIAVQILNVERMVTEWRAHPVCLENLGQDIFMCDLLGLLRMISLPLSYFFSFSLLGMIKPYMVSYMETKKGGSALSCNIDEQALITIITAVLNNVVWTCDTSMRLNSPFHFKNKGFNFIFVVCLYLNFVFVVF